MEACIKTLKWLLPLYLLFGTCGTQVFAQTGWDFSFAPEFSFIRIDATDKLGFESSLASKSLVPALGLMANFRINQDWGTYGKWRLALQDLKTSSTQDSIENSQATTHSINIGTHYRASEISIIGGGLALSQQIFVKRTTGNTLRLLTIDIPAIEVFYRTRLHQSDLLRVHGEAAISSLLEGQSDGIETSSGFAWKASIVLSTESKFKDTSLQIFFEQRDQDSNLEKWKSQQLGFNFNINYGGE